MMIAGLTGGTVDDSVAATATAAAATNTIAATPTTPLARTRANAPAAGEIRTPTAGEILDLFEVQEGATHTPQIPPPPNKTHLKSHKSHLNVTNTHPICLAPRSI